MTGRVDPQGPSIVDLDRLRGIGVWSSALRYGDRTEGAAAVAELEALGYEAVWLPDVGGDLFAACEAMLAATSTLVVATGILNLWLHGAADAAAAYHRLTEAHGPRFLVGIGVSHQVLVEGVGAGEYVRPYRRMVDYLDELDALDRPLPRGARVLAALGPRMIALAGERAAGTHPYLGTPDLTRRTREQLGPDAFVAPEQAVVLETDPGRARALARGHLSMYLTLPNYARSIVRSGWDEADLADGGSDRLVDRLVAWGDEDAVAARVAEHRDAGADHVCVQVLTDEPTAPALEQWRRLAPVLVPAG